MAFFAVIGAVIAGMSAAAAVAATVSTLAMIAIGVGVAALSYIASSSMMKIGSGGLPTYGSTSSSNSRSTSPSTGIPIIYGGDKLNSTTEAFVKVGSIIAWQNVPNDTGAKLCTVHAISIGECGNKINQIYIDNVAVLAQPITKEGIVDKTFLYDKFRPYLQLEVRFGKSTYSNSMSLAKQYGGSQWTDAFRGDGLVQICSVITKTEDSMLGGILTNQNYALSVEMKGRLITDIVTGKKTSSSNPVSQTYDYLTNEEFGFGFDSQNIDLASFQNIAQYCINHNLFSNGTIDYSKTYKENLENILQTFSGVIFESAGKIYLTVDTADIPVFAFDESSIIGEVQVVSGTNTDYYNTMDCTYTNPVGDYSTDIVRYPSDLYESEQLKRDGVIIKKDLSFLWVQDKDQLSFLANKEMRKSQFLNTTITFNSHVGHDLKVYDVVTMSFPEMGYLNKKFRVLQKTIPLSVTKVGINQFTLIEYFDEIYSGTDIGNFPQAGTSTLPNSQFVQPPTNLIVVKKGNTVNGGTVVLNWDFSPDGQVRGYHVRYKKSTSNVWVKLASLNQYQNSYEVYGLEPDTKYDFGVCAYNNLGVVSELITVMNSIPQLAFILPAITGLKLDNGDIDQLNTNSTDFNISWDNQNALQVNGKPFSQYLKYYELKIYDGNGGYLKSYYSQVPNFNYTFEMNKGDGIGRNRIFGIIAWGFSTNIYSQEIQISVQNPQSPALAGIQFKSGFEQFFVEWTESTVPDYAGIVVMVALNSSFSSGVQYFQSPNQYSTSFKLADGSYFIKAGQYDKFGIDGVIYSPPIGFNQNSKVPYSKLNDDVVDGIINSPKMDGVIQSQVTDELGSKWQLQVSANGNIAGLVLAADGKESVATFVADRFSIIGTDAAALSTKVYPFVVQNGKVFINSAVIADASIGSAQITDLSVTNAKIQNGAIDDAKIKDASITNAKIQDASISTAKIQDASISTAKIGSVIQSTNYVANTSGWQLNKAGTLYAMNADIKGKITATSGTFSGTLSATDGEFSGTIYADKISGDVTKTYILNSNTGPMAIASQPFARILAIPCILSFASSASTSGSTSASSVITLYVNGNSVLNWTTQSANGAPAQFNSQSYSINIAANSVTTIEYRSSVSFSGTAKAGVLTPLVVLVSKS
ncbi:fibronectin type III domain-containing protein [Yersinia aleksiciae]|uniref:Putative phage tail protein n=1 Tax=Yersinia aleksiciae TaxID=263819 RepID=A0A0T9TPH4_YERAE|nr:fibronectin type III domain-containing protein [Yersinia aleksiciae]MDN0124214.1 fibronectin type III domain-containing protein [Yersinia aleksiciae]CNK94643.1 putative phage tail protein [Yersinia aleksiciae]